MLSGSMSHRLLLLAGASAVLASSGATAALAQPQSQGDYGSYQSPPPGYDGQQAQGDGYYDDGNGGPPPEQGVQAIEAAVKCRVKTVWREHTRVSIVRFGSRLFVSVHFMFGFRRQQIQNHCRHKRAG